MCALMIGAGYAAFADRMLEATRGILESIPDDQATPTLAAALAVPEVAAMWHALLVWDQAHRTGSNEPLQVAFETGQSALDAIRAADPVTKSS